MGSEKVDIMTNNTPFGIRGSTNKFLVSLFAHTDNIMTVPEREVNLKIPFTFNTSDIIHSTKVDTRIAGFGPLFSGIIVLSVILLSVYLYKKRNFKKAKGPIYIILILAFSISIMPNSWWARYIPQLWFIPLIILLLVELYDKYSSTTFTTFKYILYIAFIINISFTFIGIGWNFAMSRLVDYQIEVLKASKKPVEVQWRLCSTNHIRFQENNISYIETDLSKRNDIDKIVRSHGSLFVTDSNVNIPKSNFIQWAEKFIQPEEIQ
jgi:hypothetical protein